MRIDSTGQNQLQTPQIISDTKGEGATVFRSWGLQYGRASSRVYIILFKTGKRVDSTGQNQFQDSTFREGGM